MLGSGVEPLLNLPMSHAKDLKILGIIWLLIAIHDRLWLAFDRTIPAWDMSHHLTGSLNHLNALQTVQLTDGDWWLNFWRLSHKYPPLTYTLAAPFQQVFGVGLDAAAAVNLVYLALLLIAVYHLGRRLFDGTVGLWAAGITVLMPTLYFYRLDYLLDTGVTTLTVLAFTALTIWWGEEARSQQWRWAVIFGISLGFALMTKQNVMFFLIMPLLWVTGRSLWRRQWGRLGQLILSAVISLPIWGPWYRTNWIYLFSTAQNANAIPASLEGDPPLNTWAAWSYYARQLPHAASWVLLIVPAVGLLVWLFTTGQRSDAAAQRERQSMAWLLLYWGGAYLVCSAIFNKDSRFVMPYLPVLAVILAQGLTQWRRWLVGVRWLTVGAAAFLMVSSLYPIPQLGEVTRQVPDLITKPFHAQPSIPLTAIVDEVVETAPYLRSTVAVVPSTPALNHNTFNFYGNREHFQVYGRELGGSEDHLQQDARSHLWFITQTQQNEAAPPNHVALGDAIAADPRFKPEGQWTTADQTVITLHHRRNPPVRVINQDRQRQHVILQRVNVPASAPPGQPVPITYEWTGPWAQLHNSVAVITWIAATGETWTHDHGIGLGNLHTAAPIAPDAGFRVVENLAMLPPADLPAGDYAIAVTLLDRTTAKAEILTPPSTTIRLDPAADPQPAPELDYVTQLRQLAQGLPQGRPGLEPIFQQIGRINQYDPIQDYLAQAEAASRYRLQQNANDRASLYSLALAAGLQEDAQTTLTTMQHLAKIAPATPIHHAYVAFVHLYLWQPRRAEAAIALARKDDPTNPDFQTLDGIAALMQGNLFKAWRELRPIL